MDNKIKYVDLNGLKVFAEALKQDLKNHVLELGLYQELLHRIENLELYKIVDSLPEIGDEDTIYLLKNPSGSGDKNVFIEYLYNNEHGWEEIGNFTPSFDLEDYVRVEDAPFEKGEAENSAVLKGGNNQVISEGSVALGKDNISGLKGWYYKAVQIGNDGNVVYLYLTTEQQIPIFVSSASAVENQEKNINFNISKGDICSIINGNRLIDCFEVRLNEMSKYGRISFIYKGEGTNPLSIIQNVEELKLEDYSVFCISKPSYGIVELSKCNIALGNNTKSLAESSVSIGLRSTAAGITTYAEGQDTIAVGECAHAEGAFTKANGIASHTEGFGTQTEGLSAHAEGYNTLATGGASHSEGSATKATGLHSHAEGDTTEASGEQSHAEGKLTKAKGYYSHAEGWETTAKGTGSHAEGGSTTAEGYYSHAEGRNTKAEGYYSHAEGNGTKAGSYAHAEGGSTTAEGYYSHAEGVGTQAKNNGEHAEGRFNKSNSAAPNEGSNPGNTAHSVGIGTSSADRKNAHEIMQDGKHYILGIGGYNGTNPDKATDVASELTELSAEVSGLSERIENLPTAESSVFEAVYGETTYNEIIEAHNEGKIVICQDGVWVTRLTRVQATQVQFQCSSFPNVTRLTCSDANVWSRGSFNVEHNMETLANGNVKIKIATQSAEVATPQYVENAIQQSGGSTTPDWNAAEGEAGYIKNKPFYGNADYIIDKSGEYNNVPEGDVIFYNKVLFNLRDIAYNDVIVINSGPPVTLEKRQDDYGKLVLIIEDISSYLSANPIIISNLVTIPEIFIPDTIAKKSDIVVDPIVWKYICNPLIIEEQISIPDELYDKDRDWLKYEYPAMYRFYNGMEYKFCVKADYDRLTDSEDLNWYMHGQTFYLE